MRHPQTSQLCRNRGFSIIELMVALTIGLILIVGLSSLMVGNMQGYGELNKASQQIENSRYASQFLRDELRMAGYYGNLTFLREAQAFPADPCSTGKSDVSARFDVFLQGWDSVSTSGNEFECVSGMRVKEGTDVLLLRRASSREVAVADRSSDQVYLATSANRFSIISGQESVSDVSILADPRFNKVRRLYEHVIFVSECSVCTGTEADEIPTLKMLELKNGSWSDPVPLVEGVDDLQVNYGLDVDGNSTPEKWVVLPSTREEWASVAGVRFHLLMRNVDGTRGHSDSKVYAMGLNAAGKQQYLGPFDDGFKRHAYSMTVRLRNAAERREE